MAEPVKVEFSFAKVGDVAKSFNQAAKDIKAATDAIKKAAADLKAVASSINAAAQAVANATGGFKTASSRIGSTKAATGPRVWPADFAGVGPGIPVGSRMSHDTYRKKYGQQAFEQLGDSYYKQFMPGGKAKAASAPSSGNISIGMADQLQFAKAGIPDFIKSNGINKLLSVVKGFIWVSAIIEGFKLLKAGIDLVIRGFKFLWGQLVEVGDRVSEHRFAQLQAGGTTPEMAQGTAYSAALGISPQDMAQRAHQFQMQVAMNGMTAAMAARAGVTPSGYPWGTLDAQKMFNKEVHHIVFDIKNDEQALREAMLTGTTDFLRLRDASDELKNVVFGLDQAAQEAVYSTKFKKSGNEFSLQIERLSKSFATLKDSVIGPFIGPVADTVGSVASELNQLAEDIAKVNNAAENFTDWVTGWVTGSDSDSKKSAQNMNDAAEAMRNASVAIQGLYGASSRGKGALPAGWRYSTQAISQGWYAKSQSLGAFGL